MFKVGDIVKKNNSDVHGIIIERYFDWYKVLWLDEATQKENFNHSYPSTYMVKVS